MKLSAVFLGFFAAILLSFSAFADGRELATKNFRELSTLAGSAVATGDVIPVYDASAREVKKIDATGLPFGGQIDVSRITASTSLTGNPLQQSTLGVLTTAQVNSGATILNATTNKTIYPSGGLTLMASGSAAAATAIVVRCTGGNTVASFPVAMLTTGAPVGPFKSDGAGGPTLASALTRGCPAGEGVMISNTGSAVTTATHFYYSLPYTVQ